jgi:3,4-dihydroxy 2-butanone 4-phosphate synthase
MAGIPPAVVVCEMLDNSSGGSLSRSNAISYARNNDFVFLDQSSILEPVSET